MACFDARAANGAKTHRHASTGSGGNALCLQLRVRPSRSRAAHEARRWPRLAWRRSVVRRSSQASRLEAALFPSLQAALPRGTQEGRDGSRCVACAAASAAAEAESRLLASSQSSARSGRAAAASSSRTRTTARAPPSCAAWCAAALPR
jgi:hypothetical protein